MEQKQIREICELLELIRQECHMFPQDIIEKVNELIAKRRDDELGPAEWKQVNKEYLELLVNCKKKAMERLPEYASIGTEDGSPFPIFADAVSIRELGQIDYLQIAIVSHPSLLRIAAEYLPIETNKHAICIAPRIADANSKAGDAFRALMARDDVEVIFDEREHEQLWDFKWGLDAKGNACGKVHLPYASDRIANLDIVQLMIENTEELRQGMRPEDIGLLFLPNDAFDVVPDITRDQMVLGQIALPIEISYDKVTNETLSTLMERASWLPRIVLSYAEFAGISYGELDINLDNVKQIHEELGIEEGIKSYRAGIPIADICA